MSARTFLGKFRGVVDENVDPMRLGRLRVRVPDVLGENISSWALPCVPYAGGGSGFFAVPEPDAKVWVEFEQGDPGKPIWTGCYFDDAKELPSSAQAGVPKTQIVVLQTAGGHSIVLNDLPGAGGISFKHKTGAKIEITDTGITIDNGQGATIVLQGPKVDINNQALTLI